MSDVKWQKPKKVDGMAAGFGATARELAALLPPMREIPEAFREDSDPWCHVVGRWFFAGLPASVFVAREGIDRGMALSHLGAIMRSFEPKHEHKIAGVAYLCSLWFRTPDDKALRVDGAAR